MKSKHTPESTRVLKPYEFATLLQTAAPVILPTIVLSGFCALRLGEILPLDWSAINLLKKTVSASCYKLGRSRHLVPLPDAAIAWLTPITRESGRVADYSTRNAFRVAMQRLWQAAGIEWRSNHLRLSVLTHLLCGAPTALDTVEASNESTEKTENHQLNGISKEDAEHWFTIFPAPSW